MVNPVPELDPKSIRRRQKRLVELIGKLNVDMAILVRPESVRWLTGAWVGPLFNVCAAIDADGKVTLVMPSRKEEAPALADRVLIYPEKRLSTMCDATEQINSCAGALLDGLQNAPKRSACEFSSSSPALLNALGDDCFDLDPYMARLRRKKEADELELMRLANEANHAMYERARAIIEPGLNELDLYNELHTVAVKTVGEPLTYFGQDFRSGARGGPPRNRSAEAGELWILDLGVGLRGYYSDNARTIAVSEPTSDQIDAHRRVADVFPIVEALAKPGASCKELFETVQSELASAEPWVFNHHLGHGVGLAPHEAPRLNPNWDDKFEEGDFFTAEPGLYHESLKHGIRLEQNYVVTSNGVELLTPWSLDLT